MTRKISLFVTAMMLIISASMYGQKLQKINLGIQTPKFASKNVMTSKIEIQGSEYWTGYWNGELNEQTGLVGVHLISFISVL